MKSLTLQSVALLALATFCLGGFVGCDTNSHGGSPTPAGETNGAGGTADADSPSAGTTDTDNNAPGEGDDATAAAEPMPLPVRSDEVVEITFDDVNINMLADMVFRPALFNLERVNNLDGRRVRIGGVMHGGTDKLRGIKEFILLKNAECKFGPGGQADHLVSVTMKDGETTEYLGDKPISVEGTFRLKPWQGPDGFTWSIYELENAENVYEIRTLTSVGLPHSSPVFSA